MIFHDFASTGITDNLDCLTKAKFDKFGFDFTLNSSNQSNVLALSLDVEKVGISSFKYDDKILFEDYIEWYEEKVLGSYIINNYDIYYHKLYDVNNIAMVIYIGKELKNNIIESCRKNNFTI